MGRRGREEAGVHLGKPIKRHRLVRYWVISILVHKSYPHPLFYIK